MLYVMQVFTGEEKKIRDHFLPLVFSDTDKAYIPTCELQKKIRGEYRKITKPIFPGYIIVRTDDAKSLFFKLKNLPEFMKLLRNEDFFLPLTENEEEALQRLGGEDMHVEMSVGVLEGDTVKIISGALLNYTGEITYINRHKRFAKIKIEMFGAEREVRVGLEVIKKS